jgi:RNA polymerase sigma-70 factor (ECF subfamily)
MSEPSIDALLAHSRWVNSLASSLARDPGQADDLVQEAWVQVLRRGPTDDRSPRGWLATLLRRRLRQMRRGDERRVAREQSRAREVAVSSTAEVVERAELHRNLVQSVLELREPFRTTVLLRYLEERSPEEIARLTGVPVATVHSRLGRGLAALRTRLGKQHDERPGSSGCCSGSRSASRGDWCGSCARRRSRWARSARRSGWPACW